MPVEAILTKIAPLSSHDGPGLRTTLFFKGCSLQCRWCHNPETIHSFPELTRQDRICIGCRKCKGVCESGAIDLSTEQGFIIDREKCRRCLSCVAVCPSGALSRVGKRYTLEEVMDRIIQEEGLIKELQGGITFSGGEPVLQASFIYELSTRLKERGFHLALDTCGQAPFSAYKRVLPLMDLLLFDIKEIDPRKHAAFTGCDNQRIIHNLHAISEEIRARQLNTQIWIRTPLIPGMTATSENMDGIGQLLTSHFQDLVDRWELCAFNNMCADKYWQLGLDWQFTETPLSGDMEATRLVEKAKESAPGIKQIIVSGLLKKQDEDGNRN